MTEVGTSSVTVCVVKDGNDVKVQFSVDGSTWHDTASVNDVYMRSGTSTDGINYTYSGAVMIKGEQGIQGVKGDPGADGIGVNGTNGDTAVRVYQLVSTSASDPSPPQNGTTFPPTNWSASTYTVAVNQKQYQCDGIKNGISGNIVWNTPYLSLFKVDTLDAFTVKTGSLTSTSPGGERLSINENNSHEFRCYSTVSPTIPFITMGEQAVGSDTIALFTTLANCGANYGSWVQLRNGAATIGNAVYAFNGHVLLGKQDVSNNFTAVEASYSSGSFALGTNSFGASFIGAGGSVQLSTASYAINAVGQGLVSANSKIVNLCTPSWAISTTGGISVDGNFTASGNGTFYDGSDRRLKKRIRSIPNPIEKLKKIGGYLFSWRKAYYRKQDQELFKEHDIGVIAQELQEVIPEAVHLRRDGTLGVDYKKIIPLLIECVKNHENRLASLEAKNGITS